MVENISTHKKDIENLIRKKGSFPQLSCDSMLRDVIDLKEKFNFGTVIIVDNNDYLLGIITDGDLRRIITKSQKHYSALMMESVKVFINKKPISINNLDISLDLIKKIFVSNKILDLVVVNDDNKVMGIIHIHDIFEKYV